MGSVWAGLGGIVAEPGTPLAIALAILITITAPLADRFVIRRKRIDYRVLYNSKIGLNPIPQDIASTEADPRLRHLTTTVDRMSVAIIRIRNVGSFDIERKDFETPISCTFGRRVVWDARISEASTDDLHQRAKNNLVFFSDETAPEAANRREQPREPGNNLRALRDWLARRLSSSIEPAQQTPATELGPQWHGVRLTRLSLRRNEKFKLVVVLQEPEDAPAGEITKTIRVDGRIENGWFKDEKAQPRLTWTRLAVGLSVLLTGALIGTSLFGVITREPAHCASGEVQITGSSAFLPIVEEIADEYEKDCSGAKINVAPTSSIDGLDALRNARSDSAPDRAVFSDGRAADTAASEPPAPVALVTYAIVVNNEAGVHEISTADLRAIFSGEKTDWSQVAGGSPGPIKIVDRDDSSGTRRTFERKIAPGTSSGPLPMCDSRELSRQDAPVHCQAADTEALLNRVGTTPGAIGYADAGAAAREVAEDANLTVVPIDATRPEPDNVPRYRFWTVEQLYTAEPVSPDSLLGKFKQYMAAEPALGMLRDAGYPPCADRKATADCRAQ
ncbi:substrate-binding domain-containing protein [Saccharopolyspora sp. HNM0986]|uniref:PstS family phosphate ABC transporter substrate-binding protein n=1 Tax=Saccharopolyspora galaxeae TaxID=2781241 RepID=UPI00190CD20C|nr:substrate-binding domain-containing protein [Saccharopolyspora sp. HNM0986]MBK0868940.1 substrate-binding domain-containing protein [Saccharopolyspora sp. HNM0986]